MARARSVVAWDSFGVSGRAMLAALVAGERDPKVLARMARTRLRAMTAQLEEAFVGRFSDHHAFLLATMLSRVDQASADSTELDRKIEEAIAPFAPAADRLDEITRGRPRRRAGAHRRDRHRHGRFPTPGHLVTSGAVRARVKESAGKTKGNATTGHGNPTWPGS